MTRLRFLIGGLLLIAAGCRNPASGAGTSILLTINFGPSIAPTQFSISAFDTTADAGVFDGGLDPQTPASSPLASGSSVLITLADHPQVVGDSLDIHVDGLVGSTVVGSGDSSVTIVNGVTVPVTVTLTNGNPSDAGHDAGTDGGSDGGGDAGPGCTGCTGCCSFGVCISSPDVHQCGIDGGQCIACLSAAADGCDAASGSCSCGGGPACTGQSDTCLDAGTTSFCACGDAGPCPANELCDKGICQCGTGATCGGGTVCDNLGHCVCSADAGCLNGCCVRGVDGGVDTCGSGTMNNSCGSGGATCQDCTIAGGTCSSQQCTSCNSSNCKTGCCSNGSCQDAGFVTCGSGGGACTVCDLITASACDGGVCQCGKNPACNPGEHCVAGNCVCDGAGCPGCCQSNACNLPSPSSCGIDGGACFSCGPGADTCTDGACFCGGRSPCQPGQTCANGVCTCVPSNCTGCCSGDQCVSGQSDPGACGPAGTVCMQCGSIGNLCCSGVCKCGSLGCTLAGPACTGGKHCTNPGLGFGCN
jgi:hypothetical protein